MNRPPESAVRVKLCGMTRPQDAALASALGADAIGMIFYPSSARNVSLSQALEIASIVSPLCTIVAVVVNPEPEEMNKILGAVPIHAIQFHGNESAEFCEQFGRPYIKAVHMRPDISLTQYLQVYGGASALLLDTHDEKLVGGTGRSFDWSILGDELKHDQSAPEIMLAGGLKPDNIKRAMSQTGITHLDINSGIETAPGVKDHDKMRTIMQIKSNLDL